MEQFLQPKIDFVSSLNYISIFFTLEIKEKHTTKLNMDPNVNNAGYHLRYFSLVAGSENQNQIRERKVPVCLHCLVFVSVSIAQSGCFISSCHWKPWRSMRGWVVLPSTSCLHFGPLACNHRTAWQQKESPGGGHTAVEDRGGRKWDMRGYNREGIGEEEVQGEEKAIIKRKGE